MCINDNMHIITIVTSFAGKSKLVRVVGVLNDEHAQPFNILLMRGVAVMW